MDVGGQGGAERGDPHKHRQKDEQVDTGEAVAQVTDGERGDNRQRPRATRDDAEDRIAEVELRSDLG